MNEHIFRAPEHICKPKPLALIEPFHTRRFQGGVPNHILIKVDKIRERMWLIRLRHFDPDHLDGLNPSVRLLCIDFDPRGIRNCALTKIPQNIGVQKHVGPAIVAYDKTKALDRIEPLHLTDNSCQFSVILTQLIYLT